MKKCPVCGSVLVGVWEQDLTVAVWVCRACEFKLNYRKGTDMNDREVMAIAYVNQGLFVIPLNPKEKWITLDMAAQIGWDDATETPPTPDDIHHWFEVEPELNIGIRMKESGLTVVDIDRPEKWNEWRAALDDFPQVPTVKTGKGKHYYFRAMDEDVTGAIWTDDGFYVGDYLTPKPPEWKQWHKAYVVAPPSVNEEGHVYKWLTPLSALGGTVPEWIREAVRIPEEPHSWIDYGLDDEYESDDDYYGVCNVCGGEFWDGGTSCTCPPYGDPEPDPERDALENLVQEMFDARFPPGSDGPPENFDWADLYQEADEELARRAAEGDLTLGDFEPGPSIETDKGNEDDPFIPPF